MSCVHMTDDEDVRRAHPRRTGAAARESSSTRCRASCPRRTRAAARALALGRDHRLPRPRMPRTRAGRRPAAQADDGLDRRRRSRRRVRADDARGDGARRPRCSRRRPALRSRGTATTSRWWSSAPGSPGCWPRSGSSRPASRSPSSRRIPGVGGTWWENTLPRRPGRRRQPLLLLQLRTVGPLDRVLRPPARAAGATSHDVMRPPRPRRPHPLRHRGRSVPPGTSDRAPGRSTVRRRRRRDRDAAGPGGDQRGRPAQRAVRSRISGCRELRRTGLPHRPLGPRRRPHRPQRRDDRRRRDRLPTRPGDRRHRSGR